VWSWWRSCVGSFTFTSQISPVTLSRVQAQSFGPLPSVAEAGSSEPSFAILVKSNPALPPPTLVSTPATACASRP
jgi:hypothetical protein